MSGLPPTRSREIVSQIINKHCSSRDDFTMTLLLSQAVYLALVQVLMMTHWVLRSMVADFFWWKRNAKVWSRHCCNLFRKRLVRRSHSWILKSTLALPALLLHLRKLPFSLQMVRFCVTDGENWIFLFLKLENGIRTYYQSEKRSLSRATLVGPGSESVLLLREIVQLLCEWVSFSVGPHTICFS